jgi:hypothetical protein
MPKPSDHETEKDYRRGYRDGVAAMISCLVDKLEYEEKEKIDAWFTRELAPWSQTTGKSLPPDPPRLD